MNKVRTLELFLTTLGLIFFIICIILIPVDIFSFYQDPETYSKVHQLGDSENWAITYLKGWIYPGLFILSGAIVTALRLVKRNNRVIKKINIAFLVATVLIFTFGLFQWSFNGFDH
jgi:hypothetical protein